MFDQFFTFYFSYFNSAVYGLMHIFGILGGCLLLGRTRNRGPLLIVAASITKLLVGVFFPLSNYLEDRFLWDYERMQMIWLSLSLADLVSMATVLLGIFLVAKDFRSLLDAQQPSSSL